MATFLKYENGLLVPIQESEASTSKMNQNLEGSDSVVRNNKPSSHLLNVLIVMALVINTLLTIAVAIQIQ